MWLDFVSCVSFRISALDSESTLDFVFLKVAFSRIFSNFLESCVCAKEKGFPLSPLSPAPKRIKRRCFCCGFACNPLGLFGNWGECLVVSLSRQNGVSLEKSAVALLPPFL